jgi:hypothetical protein
VAADIVAQMKQAGLNTLGNWSDEALFGRMPYVTSLPRFPETPHKIFRDFPDVLSPAYREDAERCAQALLPRRDDPFMIGYFLRNEPSWAFVDGLILADEVLRDPQETCCKAELIAFLQARYGGIDALNRAWGSEFAAFEFARALRENVRPFPRLGRRSAGVLPEPLRSLLAVPAALPPGGTPTS